MNIYRCFPGGKFKALTLSYDDGKKEDRRLVSIFNRNGLKATFNINSGIKHDSDRIPLEEMPELYAGHEVACHTSTHPTIARCPLSFVAKQVLDDRTELETVMGYPVRGLAYPNGSYNEEITRLLPSLGIEYGRIVGNSGGFAMPEDYYRWKATCHHNCNLMEYTKQFSELYKSQYLYLMYVWGHSYEFPLKDNWALIEEFSEYIGGRDDIWYATNIEIVDYMKACDRLQFSADCKFAYNPSIQSVWLEAGGKKVEIKGGCTVSF